MPTPLIPNPSPIPCVHAPVNMQQIKYTALLSCRLALSSPLPPAHTHIVESHSTTPYHHPPKQSVKRREGWFGEVAGRVGRDGGECDDDDDGDDVDDGV